MTMKSDARRDPAEGSRSTIEADLAERGGGTGTGTESGGLAAGGEQLRTAASDLANDLARDLPGRVEGAMDAIGSTAIRLRDEDEQTLTAAYAAGLGLTLGLLFAGANRLLVLAALGPTAWLGAALFGRLRTGSTRMSGAGSKGR